VAPAAIVQSLVRIFSCQSSIVLRVEHVRAIFGLSDSLALGFEVPFRGEHNTLLNYFRILVWDLLNYNIYRVVFTYIPGCADLVRALEDANVYVGKGRE
jgi:hypothetical protein